MAEEKPPAPTTEVEQHDRFRYRKSGPNIKFTLTLHDPRKAFDDAFDEACAEAAEQTNLALLLGTPES